MGLFVKKAYNDSKQLYTLGLQSTKLLVGLGNPGKEYDGTRHNVGFAVVDAFVAAHDGTWRERKDLKCLMSDLRLDSTRVLVIKPTTFMNLSGEAVAAVSNFYKITSSDTYVVHDELDIPFGQIRSRKGGSSAGHNGIKSLIQHIGESFIRLRVGIGPKLHAEQDSADFVLGKFSAEQAAEMKSLTRETIALITENIFSTTEIRPETRHFLL